MFLPHGTHVTRQKIHFSDSRLALVNATNCRLFTLVAARDTAALAHVRWIIIAQRPHILVIGLEPSAHSSHARIERSQNLSET